jgi:hypothetical protein
VRSPDQDYARRLRPVLLDTRSMTRSAQGRRRDIARVRALGVEDAPAPLLKSALWLTALAVLGAAALWRLH